MVWSHYANEVRLTDTIIDDDGDNSDGYYNDDKPVGFHEWVEEYSDDLFNIWMGMKGYREDVGITHRFMQHMDWNDFCEMCYKFSV